MRSHGAAFAPLPTWQEEDEPPTPQPQYTQPYNQTNNQAGNQQYNQAYNQAYSQVRNQNNQAYNQPNYSSYEAGTGNTTHISAGPEVAPPLRYNPVHVPEGRGTTPIADAHMSPTNREIDDFSLAYGNAVSHNGGDEDRQPLTIVNPDPAGDNGSPSGSDSGSPARNGSRPLWQQNRRQSRNLMWM
jgi:hypothetical protein